MTTTCLEAFVHDPLISWKLVGANNAGGANRAPTSRRGASKERAGASKEPAGSRAVLATNARDGVKNAFDGCVSTTTAQASARPRTCERLLCSLILAVT